MEQRITFDQLPVAVNQLSQRLENIEKLLTEHTRQQNNNQLEELFTVQQAAEFLNLSVPTIYSKVSRGELPVMKRSKRLYFSRQELIKYVKQGRKKTLAEITEESDQYFIKKKGQRHDK